MIFHSTFLRILNGVLNYDGMSILSARTMAVVWMAWALSFSAAWGQKSDKAALQLERDRIDQQLKTTANLLEQAQNNRNTASQQVSLLDNQIELRERKVNHHYATIRSLERDLEGKESELRILEGHVAALKDEYARMIQQAYEMMLGENAMLYVFAADDFSQSALRLQLMQSFAAIRKEQLEHIQSQQLKIQEVQLGLTEERAAVEQEIAQQQSESNALQQDKRERSKLLVQLQDEEERLRTAQTEQQQERQRLNDEIKRLIEEELEAERLSSSGEFALTPEGKIVSEAFENNRRSLPWPVVRGVVTQQFGRQAHPTLSGITIDNNGIDITTAAGNRVSSIFEGTVSSVFPLPGVGTTVIVTHGAYRTVYTNLTDCQVQKGTAVDVGSFLGNVVGEEGANALLHFEVWKVVGSERSPVDPQKWLQAK